MMNPTCIIIDDERPALKLLEAYVDKVPYLDLLAVCDHPVQAIQLIQQHQPDILFLDIQMPKLTGLELLEVINYAPKVVFTTAHRDHAVEGFALNAIDYLVKPFSFSRFLQAIGKATAANVIQQLPKSQMVSALEQGEIGADHFFVRTNHKMHRIELAEIQFLKSMREYVAIHTLDKRYIVNQTMNFMENTFKEKNLLRIHRSYIVNLSFVKSITGNTVRIGKEELPIGASYRTSFFEKIKIL